MFFLENPAAIISNIHWEATLAHPNIILKPLPLATPHYTPQSSVPVLLIWKLLVISFLHCCLSEAFMLDCLLRARCFFFSPCHSFTSLSMDLLDLTNLTGTSSCCAPNKIIWYYSLRFRPCGIFRYNKTWNSEMNGSALKEHTAQSELLSTLWTRCCTS